jgi:hypothetical protein
MRERITWQNLARLRKEMLTPVKMQIISAAHSNPEQESHYVLRNKTHSCFTNEDRNMIGQFLSSG